ncbi:MAG: carboxypeptidase regulatory-like domain-containing protein [Myxococcales bacterium]|nr:carboxypeptidase regulatory-like domain-containing protein [Myxococcales bacterium]
MCAILLVIACLVAPSGALALEGSTADPAEVVATDGSGAGPDDFDWDALDDDIAAPETDGDEFDWDALDETVAGDSDDDEFDWDALDDDAQGATDDDDDFDWDALDDDAQGAADDTDDFDWDALDDDDADDTDWDQYWEALDAADTVEAVVVPETIAEDRGGVRGVVLDDELDAAIAGASITAAGDGATTRAGADGTFFLELAPGTYELRVELFSFGTAAYSVLVEPGQITDLGEVRLRPADNTATIVVEGRAVAGSEATTLMERRESASVQDAIGAAQMSRSTDSSAGAAVRRVVGVTLIEDRFLVVRGLGGATPR